MKGSAEAQASPGTGRAEAGTVIWLRAVMRLVVLGLGAVHASVAALNQSMNEDGIDYLDLGAALVAGDWQHAVNGIWSPLYALVLGLAVEFFEPGPRWEFPLVHAVNYLVYILAFLAFEYFWRALSERYYRNGGRQVGVAMHPAAWLILGYSLFLYTSLNLIEMWAVTPDMSVAAFVYLAAGMALRIGAGGRGAGMAVAFGLVLGVGYLAKAVLFPLGLAAITLLVLLAPGRRYGLRGGALSVAAMLAVAGPWAALVSVEAGHPTFSEVSRFTYMKHVNGLAYPFWEETLARVGGTPEHPPLRISEEPPAYVFAGPVGGTYPPSFDPAYWTEGLEPVLDPGRQLAAVAANGALYFDLLVRQLGGVTAIVALLLILTLEGRSRPALSGAEALPVAWALLALGLYALVLVEPRYVAPFVLMLYAGLLAAGRPAGPAGRGLVLNAAGCLAAGFLWLNIAAQNLEGLAAVTGLPAVPEAAAGQFSDGPSVSHPQLATELSAMGLAPGDRVAVIGHGFAAYWARLARLRIVAEVPSGHEGEFWGLDPEGRAALFAALARSGASAIVAEPPPPGADRSGWREAGDTGYLVRGLPDAKPVAERGPEGRPADGGGVGE